MIKRSEFKLCRSGVAGVSAALALLAALAVSTASADESALNTGGTDQPGGTIKGVVKFDGRQAKRKPIRMAADPYCAGAHKDTKAFNERFVFGDNDTLQNVFVWVSKGLDGATHPAPTRQAELNQHGCVYVPHISGIVAGQDLNILNSDSTLHNVNCQADNNASFNEGMPVQGMVITKKFAKPEMAIRLKCDVHPWMSAYLHVVEHPFFAVTQQDGTFEIKGLPPGEYEVSVWHEFKRFTPDQPTAKVTLDADQTQDVTFTYAPQKKGKKK